MHDADELAALRARAYGKGADISDDPAALRRLRELEERAAGIREDGAGHGAGTEASAGYPTGAAHGVAEDDGSTRRGDHADAHSLLAADGSAGSATTTVDPALIARNCARDETKPNGRDDIRDEASHARPPDAADAPDHPDAASADSAPAEPRPFARRLAALWAASVVAASIITGIAVVTVSGYDPTVVATLHEAPQLGIPEELDGVQLGGGDPADAVRFEDYLGLPVVGFTMSFESTGISTGPNGDSTELRCIVLFGDADFTTGGCSDGGLDAIADFPATPDFPEKFLSVHDVGTAVRFVQEGNRIVVHAGGPSQYAG
ncbi:hypothetical protein [Microbacterium halotolerans]|uniref:hypothetical protein n=1 Tax=Microbacterium halotolerans TaxID=246613 RepID=UPI000E6A9E12|nr:hypothetical protein [Microbacterium halotolerans]